MYTIFITDGSVILLSEFIYYSFSYVSVGDNNSNVIIIITYFVVINL